MEIPIQWMARLEWLVDIFHAEKKHRSNNDPLQWDFCNEHCDISKPHVRKKLKRNNVLKFFVLKCTVVFLDILVNDKVAYNSEAAEQSFSSLKGLAPTCMNMSAISLDFFMFMLNKVHNNKVSFFFKHKYPNKFGLPGPVSRPF